MGWYGNHNLGDEAVLSGIIEQVLEVNDDVSLTVFSDDIENSKMLHKIDATWMLPPSIRSAINSPFMWSFRKAYLPGIKVLKKADLSIIGGGGIIADHAVGQIEKWCKRISLSIKHSKKTVIYGVGVEPLTRKGNQSGLLNVLNKVDNIVVRDEQSKQELESIGLSNVLVAPDHAFALPLDTYSVKSISGMDEIKGTVVLCPVHRFLGQDKEKYAEMHVDFMRHLKDNHPDVKVTLGLMFPEDNFLAHYLKDLSNFAGSVPLFKFHPKQVMVAFAQADSIVSTRLHSLILGALVNTPIIPIVYDVKVMNTARLIGLKGELAEFGDGITWRNDNCTDGETLYGIYTRLMNAGIDKDAIDEISKASRAHIDVLRLS